MGDKMKIKFKHITILFLIIMTSIGILTVFNESNNNISNNANNNNSTNNNNNHIIQKPVEPYGFDFLEDWQKEAYNSINQLEIGEYYFLKQDQKTEDIQLVLDLYNQNNPQLLPIIYSVIKNEGFPDYSHTIYKGKWLTSNMHESIERLNEIDRKTDEIWRRFEIEKHAVSIRIIQKLTKDFGPRAMICNAAKCGGM